MQALELEMQATVFISFFIICIAVSSFGIGHSQKAFDVVHFGAVGNGQTDDSDVITLALFTCLHYVLNTPSPLVLAN
jgi:hypothetical protein